MSGYFLIELYQQYVRKRYNVAHVRLIASGLEAQAQIGNFSSCTRVTELLLMMQDHPAGERIINIYLHLCSSTMLQVISLHNSEKWDYRAFWYSTRFTFYPQVPLTCFQQLTLTNVLQTSYDDEHRDHILCTPSATHLLRKFCVESSWNI